jgi:glutamate--cysteine ligase
MEHEKIPVRDDGHPVPYAGPRGLAAVLDALSARGFGVTRDKETGQVIGLERGTDRITMEPGGQMELSGGARATAAACAQGIVDHVREVQEAARPLGIRFLGIGARPFGTVEDVDWLPKRRYALMRDYFQSRARSGRLAHHMMKMTATIQGNFDYLDEADATDRIRTAFGVTSIVTAMYAASPIVEGRPAPYKSYRAAIWLETDEDRCGILPFVFKPEFCFRDYVDWALDVPMFFIVREGVYHPVEELTFRRFVAEGFAGTEATMSDWELHLSTVFPEVRLKRTIEVRGADAGPMPMAGSLGALWRGLLDDPEARAAAWALVAGRSLAEREALRREVPRAALAVRFGGRPLRELAIELCRIADAGLARLPDGQADRPLLDPVRAYAEAGRSPADDLLADFEAANGDPRTLVDKWELRP